MSFCVGPTCNALRSVSAGRYQNQPEFGEEMQFATDGRAGAQVHAGFLIERDGPQPAEPELDHDHAEEFIP